MASVEIAGKVRIYNDRNHAGGAMTGAPGSGNAPADYFTTDIYLNVVVMDNGDTYLAVNGGTVDSIDPLLKVTWVTKWDLYLYGKTSSFTMTLRGQNVLSTGGSHRFYSGDNVLNAGSEGEGQARVYGSLPTHSLPSIGASDSTVAGMGYTKVEPVSEWTRNGNTLTYYVCGAVFTNSGLEPNEDQYLLSQPFSITNSDIPELFEYYPWSRRINGAWKSLNREGSTSTTAGLFRRINGAWSGRTNQVDSDTTNDHGFRYNNGWKKSPKSGEGA